MNCKSKTVLLFAVGAFVLGLATSANAGELIDDVLASIEQSSPGLASAFENIFVMHGVGELGSAVESFFQDKIGRESNDNDDPCAFSREYTSICEFLDDLDKCADSLEGKLEGKNAEVIEHFIFDIRQISPNYYLSAQAFTYNDVEGLPLRRDDSNDEEIYYCDQGGVCPPWYYHFLGDVGGSTIWIKYVDKVDGVLGAIDFYVEEPSKEIPVVWKSITQNTDPPSYSQTIYFSCSIGFFDGDGKILDEIARLMLLVAYWTATEKRALDTLSNSNFHFAYWYAFRLLLESLISPSRESAKNIDLIPYDTLGQAVWDPGDWAKSPLLVLTDEWYYHIWSSNKHPDYFDHILFRVYQEGVDIKIEEVKIRLNGKMILHYDLPFTLHLKSGSPLDLSAFIELCRLLYVINPAKHYSTGCSMRFSTGPQMLSRILIEASKDYGQGWDYRYGIHWCDEHQGEKCENNQNAVWRPLPYGGWCGAYVCYIVNRYMDVPSEVEEDCKKPHISNPRDKCYLTSYFEKCLGQNSWPFNPYYISFDQLYVWPLLELFIKPGYAVAMWEPEEKGEDTKSHGTFFIDWVRNGPEPEDDETPSNNPCWATFFAIGGNQSRKRTSVDKVSLLNTACEPEEYQEHIGVYNCYWGSNSDTRGCFFGKTIWEESNR